MEPTEEGSDDDGGGGGSGSDLEATNETDDEGCDDDDDDSSRDIPTLETYVPREPSHAKANDILFSTLCARLERLCQWWTRKKKQSKRAKMAYLLPDSVKSYLGGGSPYPLLRLILPDHDSGRPHTGMKEARIGEAWARALGLRKASGHYKIIANYCDPRLVTNPTSVGDVSRVIMDVVAERAAGRGSKLTVGEVNEWLDVLVDAAKDRIGTSSSTNEGAERSPWRRSLERAAGGIGKKQDKYARLVEKLVEKELSPVEHKFVVRILLQKIGVGINLSTVMNHVDPLWSGIHGSFNSLRDLCTRLSDPEYMRLLRAAHETSARKVMESNRERWMTPSTLPAVIQKTITPMLSKRTSFRTFLKDVAHRHGQLDKVLPAESPAKSCMAIKHPAFTCEIKMDGERDLIHIKRGVVTVQTRNGTWYSRLYSPAIGPSLRAAIADYDVDVILDGEMIAWDASENKPVPFGSNRAVAEMDRNRRRRDGTLDRRDVGLHEGETDINIMRESKKKTLSVDDTSVNFDGASDDRYWLQYVVFDILYVDGPDAKKLISKSSHLFPKDAPMRTGSLINMDLMQRKSILYNLIRTQDNVVEHIKSIVVRSDGSSMDAKDYFLGRNLEYGKTPCELDSIYLALCDKSGTTKFDTQRMHGRSHEQIEVQRSMALDQAYKEIVENGGQEGLLFKDLASPYYLGDKSKKMGVWRKLKPDYDESGQAADLDLLVLGGRYATGFDKRGLVNSLVLGCLDRDSYEGGEGAKYLAVTKVTFNNNNEERLQEYTGYQRRDEFGNHQMGKWFEFDEIPDYLSAITYQWGTEDDTSGWKPEKKDRPDIWIRPEDSFVVTINAGEFQASSSMQAGFTLRFPRISRYRAEGSEDAKGPEEVVDWSNLRTLFREQEETRQDEVSFGSQTQRQTSRFLTLKQLQLSEKEKSANNSRKQTTEVKRFRIPDASGSQKQSCVLAGFLFCVQPGNYCLMNDAFATAQAEKDGWASDAKSVRSRDDVIRFIQSHGGTCELTVHQGTDFVLGGMSSDAKVSNFVVLMATIDMKSKSSKEAEGRRLVEMGGILKWSFVYAIVSRFLRRLDDDASGYEKSIKKDWPSLAQPRRSDFLAMSKMVSRTLQVAEDSYGLLYSTTSSSLDFGRALDEVGRQQSTQKIHEAMPWQSHAMNDFTDDERWIFGGKAQTLWPYEKQCNSNNEMCIMYPDLFENLGLEEELEAMKETQKAISTRWKGMMEGKSLGKVAAALPLAKALGTFVTPHLHSGVTHILCDLKRDGAKPLKWSSRLPLTIFSDTASGSRLHERLTSLEESAALNGASYEGVLLVSPEWLEKKWRV
ncbi:hypothetical protein ACHAWF_011897 [Thalassiosira exigua]